SDDVEDRAKRPTRPALYLRAISEDMPETCPFGQERGPGFPGPHPTFRFRSALDRHPDERAPLGPRAVVVADVRIAEQLMEHEPRVRGPLADAAVRDDVLVRGDPDRAVQLLQLIRLEERPRLGVDRLRPGDVRRAGYVARLLRLLLRQVRRGEQLASELLRGSHVDQAVGF